MKLILKVRFGYQKYPKLNESKWMKMIFKVSFGYQKYPKFNESDFQGIRLCLATKLRRFKCVLKLD